MAFRAFLDKQPTTAGRLRAHLQSGLLHASLLALLLLVSGPSPVRPVAVALDRAPLSVIVSLSRPGGGGGRASHPGPTPPTAAAPTPRRPRPARRRLAPVVAASALTPPGPSMAPDGMAAADTASDGQGHGGPDGAAGGGGGRGRRRAELFARIVGSGIRPGTFVRADPPFISLREATALRTWDFFPRLPASLWTERTPYLVALEVCVSAQGWVSEAALRSSASARLDAIVLAAARGWRYRPRLQGGRPAPFCHGVLIRYEASY